MGGCGWCSCLVDDIDEVFGLANKGVVEVDWGLHRGCSGPCTLPTSKERLGEG